MSRNYAETDFKLLVTKSALENDCSFLVDFNLFEIGSRVDCPLKNGMRLTLTIGIGTKHKVQMDSN